MATVLHVDGTRTTVVPQTPPSFTLQEMQALVGGYLEVVALGRGRFLLLNEEGKLQGLPYNARATERARRFLFAGDYIAGTAVVVTEQELGE
jgi:hypothetical protein